MPLPSKPLLLPSQLQNLPEFLHQMDEGDMKINDEPFSDILYRLENHNLPIDALPMAEHARPLTPFERHGVPSIAKEDLPALHKATECMGHFSSNSGGVRPIANLALALKDAAIIAGKIAENAVGRDDVEKSLEEFQHCQEALQIFEKHLTSTTEAIGKALVNYKEDPSYPGDKKQLQGQKENFDELLRQTAEARALLGGIINVVNEGLRETPASAVERVQSSTPPTGQSRG